MLITKRLDGAKLQYNIINNKKHGSYTIWYKSGAVYISCSYKHGQLHGPYTQLFESGVAQLACNYKHGKLYGEFIQRYSSGEVYNCELKP